VGRKLPAQHLGAGQAAAMPSGETPMTTVRQTLQRGEAGPPLTIPDAGVLLQDSLESETGKTHLDAFADLCCSQTVPGLIAERQSAMEDAARAHAADVDSKNNRATFLFISVGLVSPVAREIKDDKTGDKKAEKQQHREQQEEQLSAKDAAIRRLQAQAKEANKFFDQEHDRIIQDLQKMGRKIRKTLLQQ